MRRTRRVDFSCKEVSFSGLNYLIEAGATHPSCCLKQKSRREAVTFVSNGKQTLSRRFAECFDALGAQGLLDETALLHHRNLLEVGLKRAIGRALGE